MRDRYHRDSPGVHDIPPHHAQWCIGAHDASRQSMERLFLALGAASAALAVAAGAFGPHGLRARLAPELLAVFETGALYQMYHALALLGVAWAASRWPDGGAPAS